MVRASQHLRPWREPAVPRPAATVLLLRDGPCGLEVLMTRRSLQASFAPGAFVFPGGGIDDHDAQAHHLCPRRPAQSVLAVTQAMAAIRESFEELGILLARHADGRWADDSDIAALDRRLTHCSPFAEQCHALGLTPACDEVHVLAHWITDRDLPRRFDVPFLVAPMPGGQTPVADGTEQFEPLWVQPSRALQEHAEGRFFMIFPTVRTLERLRDFSAVAQVMAVCAASEAPLWTSCPRAGWVAGKESRYMEHEPPYGELALVCPDGQIGHHLDWQSDHPVALLRNVQRLTAPNPGFMTGPGTNSYIVGDPSCGHIVIDPGPNLPEHAELLWKACGGDIRAIVCTHSHPDHSPAASLLQGLCRQAGRPVPPVLGLPSGPSARPDSSFAPDRSLVDGERIELSGLFGTERVTHSLEVIFTPGHTANHLCLLLVEDGLLFSGDHILNGSTTVIDPPDGNMDDYLASLDRLSTACAQHDIEFILPAHGHVLGDAPGAIAHLKAHRLKREAKVLAAMQALPSGTPDDWVRLAYDDVPQRLWPVAKRSLLAHVERIDNLGGFNL